MPAVMYNVGDPYAWREEARAIILHGELSVDSEMASTFPSKGAFFVLNPTNGRWYSRYGSFNGVLLTIPLMAEKLITGELPPLESQTRVIFLGVFYAALSVVIACVLYLITGYYTESIPARFLFVLLAFYTTYLWSYLRNTTQESTHLLLLALCYLFFLRFKALPQPLAERSKRDIYLAWAMLFLLCQTKLSYLSLLPFFAFMTGRVAFKNGLPRDTWHPFILRMMVIPIAGICIAQAVVHMIKFGNPFLTGYHQNHDPTFPHTFWSATADFLWGSQGSIFVHFPLLFLAAFGVWRFIRLYPDESLFLLGGFLVTYALVARATGGWRGELAYGPRYFVVFLPLLSLPALYPLEWMLGSPHTPPRMAALSVCAVISAFLAAVQMEINRMDYFFKYTVGIQAQMINHVMVVSDKAPPVMRDYFANTNFAKINWDHLRCRRNLEKLPYYTDMAKHITPENLEKWKQFMEQNIHRSNLYWLPDINW